MGAHYAIRRADRGGFDLNYPGEFFHYLLLLQHKVREFHKTETFLFQQFILRFYDRSEKDQPVPAKRRGEDLLRKNAERQYRLSHSADPDQRYYKDLIDVTGCIVSTGIVAVIQESKGPADIGTTDPVVIAAFLLPGIYMGLLSYCIFLHVRLY